MARHGLDICKIDGWFSAWDLAALCATLIRTTLEEAPQTFGMLRDEPTGMFNIRAIDGGLRAARHIGKQLGMDAPPLLIGTAHHDNHAWFSFAASPFACAAGPTMVAVLDGLGDNGSISLYVCEDGRMRRLYCKDSVFDSLGIYYAVISSTQGGWTWLSSEGRYMGATASRRTDPCRQDVEPGRSAAHRGHQARRKHASASRQVGGLPDGVRGHFIRLTGSERLVLTGGVGLNALANMRLLEHFDEDYFRRELGRTGRLHLCVPPTPNDAGVPIGAAYMGAYLAGYALGPPVTLAFYCGTPPAAADIRAALAETDNVDWIELVAADDTTRDRYADFMAYMTAHDAIFALYQGAAETGPRALGHRSILANPCNPKTRENLNARVKYREAIRPLAPMMTLEAAKMLFELSDGASDDDYNAYNYMVLTAHVKPDAKHRIPSVVHADGTGRLQIVRHDADPITYAYLKALGRRIGVEVAVNTSFNVAGPIAQTPRQALATLRRSRGLDAVLMISAEGPAFAVLRKQTGSGEDNRFRPWLDDWQRETGKPSGALRDNVQVAGSGDNRGSRKSASQTVGAPGSVQATRCRQ